jgi:amino acid transporter
MSLLDILNHLFSFAAPALFLALIMPMLARLVFRKRSATLAWWVQATAHFVVGLGVLVGGVWWLERDGRMLTYGALIVTAASTQWLLSLSWRR